MISGRAVAGSGAEHTDEVTDPFRLVHREFAGFT